MDLALVMTQLGAQLRTITGPTLRVSDYPPGWLTPPAAIVGYPGELIFDATYGRGMDRMTLGVVLVVGKANERSARDALAEYCAGSGPRSIKAVVEAGTYTAFDTATVTGIDFDVVTWAAIDYIAAAFDIDITGHGS